MKKDIIITEIIFALIVSVLGLVIYRGADFIGDNSIIAKDKSLNAKESLAKFDYLEEKVKFLEDISENDSTQVSKQAESIPVLLYHGVVENEDEENISWDNFKNHMYALKRGGYNTITLKEFYDFVISGKSLSEKSFLLTFDDGRKDSYYPVNPILEKLNYNAVVFVITSRMESDETFHLTKGEIQKMIESGRWEVQSHSRDAHQFIGIDESGSTGHYLANKMWLKDEGRIETDTEYELRIALDMLQSKKDLEENFGEQVYSFAFPYGDYGQNATNYNQAQDVILRNASESYAFVFYQAWDLKNKKNYPGINTFMVKRISVESDWSSDYLLDFLESGSSS